MTCVCIDFVGLSIFALSAAFSASILISGRCFLSRSKFQNLSASLPCSLRPLSTLVIRALTLFSSVGISI